MNNPHGIRVLIRNQDGEFLTQGSQDLEFTQDVSKATVFDYLLDRVPEQLQSIEKSRGGNYVVVRLEPREAYEICDRCGSRVMPIKTYFDGQRFLCPDCRPLFSAQSNYPNRPIRATNSEI